jgi:hypothetical protein
MCWKTQSLFNYYSTWGWQKKKKCVIFAVTPDTVLLFKRILNPSNTWGKATDVSYCIVRKKLWMSQILKFSEEMWTFVNFCTDGSFSMLKMLSCGLICRCPKIHTHRPNHVNPFEVLRWKCFLLKFQLMHYFHGKHD